MGSINIMCETTGRVAIRSKWSDTKRAFKAGTSRFKDNVGVVYRTE